MPLIRRWKRFPLVWQLGALSSALLVLVCGLVIALVAENTALTASRQAKVAAVDAKQVAQCVNNVLAERNQPAQTDAAAHIAYATANAANAEAQNKAAIAEVQVLVDPTGSAQQATDFETFLGLQQAANRASTTYEAASVIYKQTLAADQADRNEHPLGTC